MDELRLQALSQWANAALDQLIPAKQGLLELEPVSGDASFRRYFRARLGQRSFIAVDAPPSNEDSEAFVRISSLFHDAGVRTPAVLSVDYKQGFMLLDDFGDRLYFHHLLRQQEQGSTAAAGDLYRQAIDTLIKLQSGVKIERLDPYDREKLHDEMVLFEKWYCEEFLCLRLSDGDRELIARTFSFLEDAALGQMVVAWHRDYHSRNLMLLDAEVYGGDTGPGVIDFQDAVAGPYTYDLVSLLRDCYIQWPAERVREWALYYFDRAQNRVVIGDISLQQFLRDLDLMGMQRNLKVMGIFSRLCIRDKKPQYLADIPMVIQYFLNVSQQYPELSHFRNWFTQKVLPVAKTKQPKE